MSPHKKIGSPWATLGTHKTASVLLALSWLVGCQQILGVDELKNDVSNKGEDGGKNDDTDAGGDAQVDYEPPSEADCKQYCDIANATCKPETPKAAFANDKYCPTLCLNMQRTKNGNTFSDDGNTFDCRLKLAQSAEDIAPDNAGECRAVGAGGEDICGSSCEGYCQLFESICGKYPALTRGASCVSECEKLPVDRTRDATAAFGSASDTLQCRLAHLGAASTSDEASVPHCKHAAISITTETTPCLTDSPRCEDFCTLTMNTCTDKMQQYETYQDCVAICKNGLTQKIALAADEPIDISHDTVACRRYHAYNALKTPTGVHCEHTGPTGDGHCGKICPSYCQLAKAACSTQFTTKYGNDNNANSACEAECDSALKAEGVPDQLDHHYSVPKGKASSADPMLCRVYRVSKAFLSPTAHCAAALGGAECAAN